MERRQAGLLASGSTFTRLPAPILKGSGTSRFQSPITAAGPPESHRLPDARLLHPIVKSGAIIGPSGLRTRKFSATGFTAKTQRRKDYDGHTMRDDLFRLLEHHACADERSAHRDFILDFLASGATRSRAPDSSRAT